MIPELHATAANLGGPTVMGRMSHCRFVFHCCHLNGLVPALLLQTIT